MVLLGLDKQYNFMHSTWLGTLSVPWHTPSKSVNYSTKFHLTYTMWWKIANMSRYSNQWKRLLKYTVHIYSRVRYISLVCIVIILEGDKHGKWSLISQKGIPLSALRIFPSWFFSTNTSCWELGNTICQCYIRHVSVWHHSRYVC